MLIAMKPWATTDKIMHIKKGWKFPAINRKFHPLLDFTAHFIHLAKFLTKLGHKLINLMSGLAYLLRRQSTLPAGTKWLTQNKIYLHFPDR